jgi:hypothetical protein
MTGYHEQITSVIHVYGMTSRPVTVEMYKQMQTTFVKSQH